MSTLFEPLRLPNGQVIRNRIAKAAMEENLADADHAPGDTLLQLYRRWAEGGAGLIITGNVMVDRRALTGPAGVVLEDDRLLPRFRRWAEACRSHGAQAWMQINHPGRQLMADLGQPALGPSAIAVDIPGLKGVFAQPRALSGAEIDGLIQRYLNAAVLAERAGFSGVQVHAAHGYLFSQFLSPLSNRREDDRGRQPGESCADPAAHGGGDPRAGRARLLRGGEAQLRRFPAWRFRRPRRRGGGTPAQPAGRGPGRVVRWQL